MKKTNDYPLGSVFKFNGVTLTVVVDCNYLGCNDCWFGDKAGCKCPNCRGENRMDDKDIVFVKIVRR